VVQFGTSKYRFCCVNKWLVGFREIERHFNSFCRENVWPFCNNIIFNFLGLCRPSIHSSVHSSVIKLVNKWTHFDENWRQWCAGQGQETVNCRVSGSSKGQGRTTPKQVTKIVSVKYLKNRLIKAIVYLLHKPGSRQVANGDPSGQTWNYSDIEREREREKFINHIQSMKQCKTMTIN